MTKNPPESKNSSITARVELSSSPTLTEWMAKDLPIKKISVIEETDLFHAHYEHEPTKHEKSYIQQILFQPPTGNGHTTSKGRQMRFHLADFSKIPPELVASWNLEGDAKRLMEIATSPQTDGKIITIASLIKQKEIPVRRMHEIMADIEKRLPKDLRNAIIKERFEQSTNGPIGVRFFLEITDALDEVRQTKGLTENEEKMLEAIKTINDRGEIVSSSSVMKEMGITRNVLSSIRHGLENKLPDELKEKHVARFIRNNKLSQTLSL